ncbi:cysteine-rich motor neuron 1 protein-like [Petromyzon marinus]|uniref:cysteine-rich motor neuron 1 protein-like n=1 Tax=Petromyzon marinus TaxID=7757 RepID=UPI003F702ACA
MPCSPVHGGAVLPGACPGLCDTSHCPAPCPAGTVCDGLKCVDPADCPCFVRGIARKSGYIWKENSGCTTCMCVAGQTQCVDEQCSICSCAEGEHPVVPEGECCPVCVPMPYACRDQRGNEYRLGEVFTLPYDTCQQCTCTEAGLSCSIVVCADTSRPCCGTNEMLVQVNVGACCPVYECGTAHLCFELDFMEMQNSGVFFKHFVLLQSTRCNSGHRHKIGNV